MPAKRFCYEYPRPSVTVDAVVLALDGGSLRVLLIERRSDPFAGRLALPGGFLELDETAEAGARRELQEETGVEAAVPLIPVGFYAAPDRDPRGRTISLAFLAAVRPPAPRPCGSDDARAAGWYDLDTLDRGGLAFDHALILADAGRLLLAGPSADRLLLTLLPDAFTRDEVAALFRPFGGDARSAARWRSRMRKLGLIRPAGPKGDRFRTNRGRVGEFAPTDSPGGP
jgi:8-oxo-dGTP diphosphatase